MRHVCERQRGGSVLWRAGFGVETPAPEHPWAQSSSDSPAQSRPEPPLWGDEACPADRLPPPHHKSQPQSDASQS